MPSEGTLFLETVLRDLQCPVEGWTRFTQGQCRDGV